MRRKMGGLVCLMTRASIVVATLMPRITSAQQPPPPCHPNPNATTDMTTVRNRGDISHLPDPLKNQIVTLAGRTHSVLLVQAYAEADQRSQLFQYYLLDTHGFEPNVFTTKIPGVNNIAMLTATGGNCGLPTIGGVCLVVEPKPALPTAPNNVRACLHVFTDISGLFVINNESGWYEGSMIHDLKVPAAARPRRDGHAQFGTITKEDAEELAEMGTHNNVPGHIFTADGKAVHLPGESDHFPDKQTNVVPIQL